MDFATLGFSAMISLLMLRLRFSLRRLVLVDILLVGEIVLVGIGADLHAAAVRLDELHIGEGSAACQHQQRHHGQQAAAALFLRLLRFRFRLPGLLPARALGEVGLADNQMRLVGMALGAALTCFVFYRNHKNRTYKRNLKDLIQEFDITSSRTKWQICQILCVPIVLCIAELCNMPRAMWAGIAAMSVILPSMEDMHYRVRKRIVGNIAGVICFTVLYFLLPSSIYAYIGILGGIGVGFSAQYGWQAVFNTFGALAIAAETYGLQGAVSLRVIQNVFGVVFALAFCVIFYWFMSKKKESDVIVHAE